VLTRYIILKSRRNVLIRYIILDSRRNVLTGIKAEKAPKVEERKAKSNK